MLFNRLAAPRAQRDSAGAPSWSITTLGSVPSAAGVQISPATAMAVSTVYACVRRRSQDVARCPPSLYTVESDGTRINIDDHPLIDLFDRPNRVQTWLEFVEQMEVSLLLRQNAYAVALRDGNGIVRELIPINPDAVMVLEAADGSLFYQVNRIGLWQMFVLNGMPLAIPAEDVLHIRGLTFNSLVGISTLGLGRDAIGLAAAQEQQAARWIANGARPSGLLETDKPLSDDAAKRLKDRWEAYKAGLQNVGSTAVLEDGVKWKDLKLTSTDLEFLSSRQFQVPEICRFFSVPPHKIYVIDRAASMSIEQQDQDYVNATITPDLVRWEQKLEQFFDLTDKDISCHFDEGQLLRADVMTRFNALRIGILTGLITPNEARESEGLQRIDGGDNLLVPANTAALGSDMTGTPADEGGRPAAGALPGPPVGTGGDQPNAKKKKQTNDGNPELPGAEELQPRQEYTPIALRQVPVERAMMLSGVPVRHQAKIRARLRGKRIVPEVRFTQIDRKALPPPLPDSAVTPAEPASERAFSLPAITVNVDATKPRVRRQIRKAEDGSLEVVEIPEDAA
jgi:HK97 family phage portal protein